MLFHVSCECSYRTAKKYEKRSAGDTHEEPAGKRRKKEKTEKTEKTEKKDKKEKKQKK